MIHKHLHWSKRTGFGTLEVVIIIAVLLTVALIFRQSLLSFATELIHSVFNEGSIIEDLAVSSGN
jgi:hypothetical protein